MDKLNTQQNNLKSPSVSSIDPRTIRIGSSPHAIQPASILGSKPLSDWRGSVTTFKGFTGTIPERELKDAGWDEICALLCPPKPTILSDKKQGQYVIPCLLREAPLVGNTLEAAKNKGTSIIGKMRSKNHATEASMLIIDVDGLTASDFMAALDKIKADGITFLAYTTHSHGSVDKPGVRARLVIPLDRSVTIEEYEPAWHGFDEKYFDGRAGKADSSGAKMYQQQGTWCCHPSRVNQAEFWTHSGGVATTDVLIEISRVVQAPQAIKAPSSITANEDRNNTYPPCDAGKIANACRQIGSFRDNKGAVQSEPLWYDCLGIVGHCQNGADICQEWSSGYSGYDKTETAKKIAQRVNTPPTTCNQFRKTNPAGCTGCTQNCKSPIALGQGVMDALPTIQQRFGLINMNGKIWVLDRSALDARTDQGCAENLKLSNRSDGKLQIERALKSQYPQADVSQIVKEFWHDPGTICYSGVEFNPKGSSDKYLNLWVGPTISPMSGKWSGIKSFLLEIVCDGDQAAYNYLLGYIAHALQRPEEKPGVMIILIGGQGIGKGTLGSIFRKIWNATYIQVNNIDAVTGNFNASLERAFIVFMDEALFSGNRRASDALKSLVTEPIIHINEKYQPARQTRSYHRFIAATNASHFKNTERDDRRDFTLRVSESRKGDHAYWNELNNEIDHGGVEAMAYDLLAMDLSCFNVRDKPNTNELLEQKLHGLEPIPRWWHDCLYRGAIPEGDKWPEFVSTAKAIEGILQVAGGKIYQKPSAISVVQEMMKLCPSAKSGQKQINHDRHRGLSLPSLQQARVEFEQYIGGAVQWEKEL
ncbi:MAG: primase-helicase family protein [Pseudomonadota bacterium]